MTDHPAVVAREARSIHAGLKTLLARDVWGNYREADFQRKNLRRRYLHLLLLYPVAREARDAVTHLWMQTSYVFITLYKQRLSRPPAHSNLNNNGNPVEGRKMLQRFRQFLADEERFWRALVLRVQRAYGYALADADAPTGIAGLLGAEEAPAPDDRTNQFGFPADAEAADDEAHNNEFRVDEAHAKSVLSKALVCLGDIARYREQYKGNKAHEAKKKLYEPRANYARPRALYMAAHALAPHEGNAAHQLAILAGYEGDTLASVAWYLRALCVRAAFETAGENLAGVLARVRSAHAQGKSEKWNQHDGSEDDVTGAGAAAGAEPPPREAPRVRVERFKRDLVLLHALWRAPNNNNNNNSTTNTDMTTPSTPTLALAAHTARGFARLVAERALPEEMIVRVGVMAQGAVWVGRMTAAPTAAAATSSGDNTDFGAEKERDKTERDRSRRRRHASSGGGGGTPAPGPGPGAPFSIPVTPPEVQAAQLAHLLALHTALLDVGVRELEEAYTGLGTAMGTGTGGHGQGGGGGRGRRGRGGHHGGMGMSMNDVNSNGGGGGAATGQELAERISAVFRRTLPALRVGSKWVLGNWEWVGEAVGEVAAGGGGADGYENANANANARGGREKATQELRAQAARFWTTYAEFLRRLGRAFPVGLLPALRDGGEGKVDLELELEEDVDMRGWLPLRGLMGGPLPPQNAADAVGSEAHPQDKNLHMSDEVARRTVGTREEVHPNVEQLMRIADLLRDARRIVDLEGSPLALYGGQFVVKGVEAAKPAIPTSVANPLATFRDVRFALQTPEIDEDAMTEKTSRTDEDILHDAFSFLDNTAGEEASDEDEIVWDLRDAPVSPVVPTARTSPKTPVRPSPIAPPSRGCTGQAPLSPFRAPQPMSSSLTPGTQIPATTALDLLNNFSVPVAPSKPLASPGTGTPGDSLLFGSRAGAGAGLGLGGGGGAGGIAQAQSIWSASRDEQGLMFAGGGGGGGHQQQQQQQHQLAPQYQGLGPGHGMAQHGAHQRFASHDLSGHSTIWASSYPTAGGQQHAVGVPGGFAQQQQQPLAPHRPIQHQRAVSNSMAAAQLFPIGGGDPYGYGPAHYGSSDLGLRAGTAMGGVGGGSGPLGSGPDQFAVFYSSSASVSPAQPTFAAPGLGHGHGGMQQHARHTSLVMDDPRVGGGGVFPGQPIPPMVSQLWSNVG